MAELRATKRNPLLGLLADALSPVAGYLSTSTNPLEDAGSDLSVTGLLGDTVRPVANTVNRMSYGEPLTTGRGMTTQMRPDTRDALLGIAPIGPAANSMLKAAKPLVRDYVGTVGARDMSGLPMAKNQLGSLYPENLLSSNPSLIKEEADFLAEMLRAKGFDVMVEHSGSAAGPSSYLKVYDPKTGRIVSDNLRLSAHSKGPFNSSLVNNVSREDFESILKMADDVRALGQSKTMSQLDQINQLAQQLIETGKKPKAAFKQARAQILERKGVPMQGLLD